MICHHRTSTGEISLTRLMVMKKILWVTWKNPSKSSQALLLIATICLSKPLLQMYLYRLFAFLNLTLQMFFHSAQRTLKIICFSCLPPPSQDTVANTYQSPIPLKSTYKNTTVQSTKGLLFLSQTENMPDQSTIKSAETEESVSI